LRQNVRQPDRGNPTPTQPLLQAMTGQVVIQNHRKTQAFRDFEQQHEIVNPFTLDGQLSGSHTLSVPENSQFR
jgi:hypothetical protein